MDPSPPKSLLSLPLFLYNPQPLHTLCKPKPFIFRWGGAPGPSSCTDLWTAPPSMLWKEFGPNQLPCAASFFHASVVHPSYLHIRSPLLMSARGLGEGFEPSESG